MYCYKNFLPILKKFDSQTTSESAFYTDAQRDIYGVPRYAHANGIIKSFYVKKLIH